jgi:transmembrane sensor
MQPSMPRHLKHAAAEWFARSLSESFGNEERVRLQDWLADDPEHIRAYNEARATWQAMEGLKNDPDLMAEAKNESAPRRLTQFVPFPRSRGKAAQFTSFPRLRGKAGMGAAAVMVLGLALGWQFGLFNDGVYTTEPWKQRTVTLADGSTVLLSANTVVEDVTDENRRGAIVHRGEAIFGVVTDKQNPFVVRAADADIIVTGTRFQVRNDEGRVAVTLIEGRVAVERQWSAPSPQPSPARGEGVSLETPHAGRSAPLASLGFTPYVLEPGQQVAFAENSEAAEVREVDVDAVTAWSRNRLVFRDAPLAEALREANRHASLKLVLKDPSLADVRVNGHFRLGDTESLLAAVRGSFPIEARRADKNEIVLTRAR